VRTTALHTVFLLAAIAWAALLYYLSAQTGLDVPQLFPGQDKVFHAGVYAVLGFLVAGSMRPVQYVYSRQQVWLAAAIVAGYGLLDEFHQSFVPGRSADLYDVMADSAGGLLGIAALIFIVSKLPGAARAAAD